MSTHNALKDSQSSINVTQAITEDLNKSQIDMEHSFRQLVTELALQLRGDTQLVLDTTPQDDLGQALMIARGVDRMIIQNQDEPRSPLVTVHGDYRYSHPDSPASAVWTAFRQASTGLGFFMRNLYNAAPEDSTAVHTRVNILITDTAQARKHERTLLYLVDAVKDALADGEVLRVIGQRNRVAEHKVLDDTYIWALYDTPAALYSDQRYAIRSGNANPLDLLQP